MFRRTRAALRLALATPLVLLSAACADDLPTTRATPPAGETVRASIVCTVTVASGQVRCGDTPAGGGARNIMLGGQGTYVRLDASNHAYDSAAAVYSIDVTVQNLLGQQMGTPDGTTVTGVKVFFDRLPTASAGTGEVAVANPDGRGAFTGAGQPYFDYPEILEPRGASRPRTWRFDLPGGVTAFTFGVYVETQLPAEQGVLRWIQEEGSASQPKAHIRGLWGTADGRDLFAVGIAGNILHFDGSRWAVMPSGTRVALMGVWGTSRSRVYAVGDSGTVLRYDGNRWNRLAGSVPNRSLRSIWGRGDTLWIAGYQRDAQGRMHGLILRSTNGGGAWQETLSTGPTGNRQLWAVAGGAGGTLIATGYQYTTADGADDGLVLRSTDGGATWSELLISDDAHRRLYRMWAQGTHVFAVGQAYSAAEGRWMGFTVRSSDGGDTWTREMHPNPTLFYGVWGASPDDVTAIGLGGAIVHWDGGAWTDVTPAGSTVDLFTVWGRSAGDVYAAGWEEAFARGAGAAWELVPSPGDRDRDYVAAWGPAPDDLYVVARTYDWSSNRWSTAVLRRTAGSWSTVRPPEEDLELASVWGSAPDDVLVAGYRAIDAHYEGVLLRYDGTSWTETVSASGPDRRFNAVHGDGAGNVWVVGNHQDAVTYVNDALVWYSSNGGQSWVETRIPVPAHTPQLFDVWASGPSDVHAVGRAFHNASGRSYGLRMRYDGVSWTQEVEAAESDLVVVWGAGNGTLYAGGFEGDFFARNATGLIVTSTDGGVTWTRTRVAPTVGTSRTINAFWSASPGAVYAAGFGGPILQLDGDRWEGVGPYSVSISSLWGYSPNDVWALGGAGVVFHGVR